MQWWVLQDRDAPEPWALCVLADDHIVRRYVPGRGLVDFPPDADQVLWAEPGGRQVNREEWMRLLHSGRNGVRLDPDVLAQYQGSAPDMPLPDYDEPHRAKDQTRIPMSSDHRADSAEASQATKATPKRYLGFPSGELTSEEALELADQLFDAINADRKRGGWQGSR